jgi:hypothetical protein
VVPLLVPFGAGAARKQSRPTSTVGVPQVALTDETIAAVERRIVGTVTRAAPVVPSTTQRILPVLSFAAAKELE